MKTIVSFIAFMLLTSMEHPSQVTIKGRVTDLSDLPLSGVTVTVKETGNSTLTGSDGTYVITPGPGAKSLLFTIKGMKPLEEPISGRTVVNVIMKPEKEAKPEKKDKDTVYDEVFVVMDAQEEREMAAGTSPL